jgi:large subunit ribosomal protein L17
MAASLILHKRITTTVAKAKALRVYVEPMITRSKNDSTHSRRMVFRYLQNKIAVTELFREVAVKVADRPGGYTRIIKLGNRLGDNAEMCMIELVDFNENLLGAKTPKKAKTTRRRGSSKKATEASTPAEPKAEVKPIEEVANKAAENEVGAPEADATSENNDKIEESEDKV